MRATGTFTKNTARQLQPNRLASVSAPPRTRPMAEAKPAMAPYSANALPRSRPEKMTRNVASTCGAFIAAPTPWTTRAAMSSAADADRPAARLAAPKTPTPARNSRLRPNRSPRLPAMIRIAANASRYPDTTHSSWVALAPRFRRIVGSATLTIVTSIRSISAPVISTAAAIQRNRDPAAAARPAPRALWLLTPAVVVMCVSSRSWQQTLHAAAPPGAQPLGCRRRRAARCTAGLEAMPGMTASIAGAPAGVLEECSAVVVSAAGIGAGGRGGLELGAGRVAGGGPGDGVDREPG